MPPLERNELLVLDILQGEANGLTRAQLRERAGLSRPTVGRIVDDLSGRGLITEEASRGTSARAGRPSSRLLISRQQGLVAGIDIGHSHVIVAVADLSGDQIGDLEIEIGVDVDAIGTSALAIAVKLLARSIKRNRLDIRNLRSIVVGIPASVDDNGRLLFSDYLLGWAAVPIADQLAKLLEKRFKAAYKLGVDNILIENDANLGALGEGLKGEAYGTENYVYVKISTGIGMGIVIRGQLYRGLHGAAGEFGHVLVPRTVNERISGELRPPTHTCRRCGEHNCLENRASCPAIVRDLLATSGGYRLDTSIVDVIRRATTESATHPLCHRAVLEAGTRVAFALIEVVRVLAPELIVVGGYLAQAKDGLTKPIGDALDGARGIPRIEVRPVKVERIPRSEIDGAIALAVRHAGDRRLRFTTAH
jgi:predicted NBD/HSP70 family sugar kinase